MLYALYTVHVVICLFLIMVVLLQQGKGADLSVFGGGGTQTAFGARGAATLLHKLTVFSFVGFILTTMGIGILKSGATSGSVMSDVPVAEQPAEAESTDPALAVEGLAEETGEVGTEIIAPVEEPVVDESGSAGEAEPGGGEEPPG